MAVTTILFKRGDSPISQVNLRPGEPGWTLDTGKLYIGIETEDGRQNKLINVLDEDEAEELLTQIESLVATMQNFLALGFDKVITISHRIGTGGNGYVTTTDDLSWLQIGRVVAITLPDVGPYYYLAKLTDARKLPDDPDTTAYWFRIFRYNETMNLIKVPIIPDDEIPDGAESVALPRLLMLVQKDIDSSELGGQYAQVHRYRRVEFIPRQITGGNIYIQNTEPSDPDCVWIDTNGIDLIME